MRINNTNNVSGVYNLKKASKQYSTQTTSSGKDEFTLSSFAKELSIAQQEVSKTSDVRMDKVQDIKSQIEAGQYNISASMIADKLLSQSEDI